MGAFNSFHFYQSAVHHSSVLKIFGMAQQVKGRLMWSKNPPKQTNKKKNKPKKTPWKMSTKGQSARTGNVVQKQTET